MPPPNTLRRASLRRAPGAEVKLNDPLVQKTLAIRGRSVSPLRAIPDQSAESVTDLKLLPPSMLVDNAASGELKEQTVDAFVRSASTTAPPIETVDPSSAQSVRRNAARFATRPEGKSRGQEIWEANRARARTLREEKAHRRRLLQRLQHRDLSVIPELMEFSGHDRLFHLLKDLYGRQLFNQKELHDFLVEYAKKKPPKEILEELNTARSVDPDIGIAILRDLNIKPEDLIGSGLFFRNPKLAFRYVYERPLTRNMYLQIDSMTAWVRSVAEETWALVNEGRTSAIRSLRTHLLMNPETVGNALDVIHQKYVAEIEDFLDVMKAASHNGGSGRVGVIDLREVDPRLIHPLLRPLFISHTSKANYFVITNGGPVSTDEIDAYLNRLLTQHDWGENVTAVFMVFDYTGHGIPFHKVAYRKSTYWGAPRAIAHMFVPELVRKLTGNGRR